MAERDWTVMNDGLDIQTLDRGATNGVERPPGGGDFVYAFNSLSAAAGAAGLFANQENFAPAPSGASIRGCIQRGPGGGPIGFAPLMFVCCQGPSVNDRAYLLGLSDDDPHRIVLRKGLISEGLPDSDGPGVLLRSGESFAQSTWLHVRLDAIVNDNGDVVLRVFQNDLSRNPVNTTPSWQPVPGMPTFVDDQTGINSGSQPLTSGRAGFAFITRDVTRRGFFDHIELQRQIASNEAR